MPSSTSGVADLPGSNLLVTLGRWNEFLGRPFVQASTAFHELGHNSNLTHGGLPVSWGNKFLNTPTSTIIEPNCKPYYLSSMSYAFQVHGLFDDLDEIHLDYSNTQHDNIGETSTLNDDPINPPPSPQYRTAWFAPAASPTRRKPRSASGDALLQRSEVQSGLAASADGSRLHPAQQRRHRLER